MSNSATLTLPALHPDHLAYLRARGISDATIAANGPRSARPGDLHRLAGRPVPDGTSGLVIPYGGCDGFCRVRLFPPIVTTDGREQKFGKPAGSPVRLYIPAGVRETLADPERSISITEGEVKALALTQAGFPAVAIGGVYNFRTKELPGDALIPDLEDIPWEGRPVHLIPDSDAWTNDQVLLAVYRLARALEQRGAAVLVVKIPPGPSGTKHGADDFLVSVTAQGKDPVAAWRRLMEKAVTLGNPAFKPFRETEKVKARAAEKPGPLPPELVARRIHPALHFDDSFASVGIVTVGADVAPIMKIITATRKDFPAETIGAALTAKPLAYSDLIARWRPEDVARFLAGEDEPPSFADAMARTIERYDTLLEVGRDCETVTLAAWAVATYFHPAFLAFPRLDIRGEVGSGKSKTLSILAAVTFNGLLRVSPTPAVLFRLAELFRPSLCLDEIEGLASDEKREILAILNSGYKAGGRVDRCEGDEHTLRSYAVFTPIALAGITGLNRVTQDRAITLVLTRGRDPSRLNADVDPGDSRFAEIRDLCYRLTLLRWREVRAACEALDLPGWLVARERELWRPLLVVATLAEREAGDLNLVADLLTLAREQGQERAGLSDEAEALVTVLSAKLNGAAEMVLSPGEVCGDLQAEMKLKDPPSPQRVGRLMKRLGFPPAPRTAGGKRRLVRAEALADLRKRYGSCDSGGEGEKVH